MSIEKWGDEELILKTEIENLKNVHEKLLVNCRNVMGNYGGDHVYRTQVWENYGGNIVACLNISCV